MAHRSSGRTNQIETDMICPLCGEPVQMLVRDAGYYGYCLDGDSIPEGANYVGLRRFGNGTVRKYYRFPGFIPHCSNNMCFLRSANRMFRSEELAKEAWEEGTSVK